MCLDRGIGKHKESYVIEAVGQPTQFTCHVLKVRPEKLSGFWKDVQLGDVAESAFDSFMEVVEAKEVDNETTEWDCQDYVLELLDDLEEEYVIDVDDEFYQEQKQKLKDMRGPF